MPANPELMALAERVEKAKGPDRELDGRVYCATRDGYRFIKMAERGDTWGDWYGDGRKNTLTVGAMLFERTDHNGTREDDRRIGGRYQQFMSSPPYTASLDAAMTLAMAPELEQFGGASALLKEAWDRLSRQRGDIEREYVERLARYVTAACLRALASTGGEG